MASAEGFWDETINLRSQCTWQGTQCKKTRERVWLLARPRCRLTDENMNASPSKWDHAKCDRQGHFHTTPLLNVCAQNVIYQPMGSNKWLISSIEINNSCFFYRRVEKPLKKALQPHWWQHLNKHPCELKGDKNKSILVTFLDYSSSFP